MMAMRKPPGAALLKFRPLLDIIGAAKFDVSINTSPYKIKLFTGTTIPAGIMIDAQDLSLFGRVIVKRAYLHFVPYPFQLEVRRCAS